jgi:hypothetical protein
LRRASLGGAGGSGDVGVVGKFPEIIGGGGISAAGGSTSRRGEIESPTCNPWILGLSLDVCEDFLGTASPFGITVAGRGGLGSSGDRRPLISEGRRPGCDDDLFLPMPRFVAVLEGADEAINFGPAVVEEGSSVGDDEAVLEGAEVFERRCEMVPITVVELISCEGTDVSERTDNIEVPRGLGAMPLDKPGDGGGPPVDKF